ncbi:hypothetical protein CR513_12013, partial [Mucuna pruriens]
MPNNAQFLTNIKKYFGNCKIHTTNGNQFPITITGDISSSLTNVFVSPDLMSNLVSIGQLVKNDFEYNFHNLADQHLGKIIAKGPKVERLFPIYFLLSPSLTLPLVSYNYAIVDYQVWHKRLGHPNSNVLHDMLKFGFVGNKHTPSLNAINFDCIPVSLAKVKFYLFQHMAPIICHANYKYFSFHLGLLLHSKDESHVSSRFWCEALSTAIHLINRLPSSSLRNVSPFTHHPITLRIFGCVMSIFLHKNVPSLMHNLLNVLFLEILLIKRAVYVMILTFVRFKSLVMLSSKKIYIFLQHNMTLFVLQFLFCHCFLTFSAEPPSSKPLLTYKRQSVATQNQPLEFHGAPKIIPWLKVHKFLNNNNVIYSYSFLKRSHNENQTWDIVSFPPSIKPLGSKFVFSIKLHLDGSIDHYKARLVVLGNKKEYGLNYDETFALIAKMTTVHTILALAASRSWSIHQMDAKNTFLHGDPKEEVYIKLPNGIHTFP